MKIENELKIKKCCYIVFVFNRYELHVISSFHRYKIKMEEELNIPNAQK